MAPRGSFLERLRYRLRTGWYRLQPLPRPRYIDNTATTAGNDGFDLCFPPTAQTLGEAAMSDEAFAFAQGVLERLTPARELDAAQFTYHWGRGKFGAYWRSADLLSTLWAAATCVRPRSYLEIGVHRGRSAALVGALFPECAIYGFDLWRADYAGVESPGPDFVRREIANAGHRGPVTLVSGDSRRTLPSFLRERPELFFDLVTVDGDKSIGAAASDYANSLARLKVGGVVVSDDVQMFPWLRRVWNALVQRDRRYVAWEFDNGVRGVIAGIRIAE